MLVSITTVTYNSAATLARTIESVLAQTYPEIEYIIVDGMSQDDTLAIAESYTAKMQQKGIKYRIISEKDRGMYDWYEPDAVEKVAAFFEKEGCDFMYADLRMIKPDGSTFIKHSKHTRIATSRGWNHPTQFARKEVYMKYPYKVESMHDDFDLLLRVMKSDYKIAILNEVLANFSMEGMSHERRLSANIKRGKARYRIYRNNGYSRWYFLECLMIETAKFILG